MSKLATAHQVRFSLIAALACTFSIATCSVLNCYQELSRWLVWSIAIAFQSPAQNYTETRLNLGDLVHLSPYSTYMMRSESDCPSAGITKGSVLVIGCALTTVHGQLIIAELDGDTLNC